MSRDIKLLKGYGEEIVSETSNIHYDLLKDLLFIDEQINFAEKITGSISELFFLNDSLVNFNIPDNSFNSNTGNGDYSTANFNSPVYMKNENNRNAYFNKINFNNKTSSLNNKNYNNTNFINHKNDKIDIIEDPKTGTFSENIAMPSNIDSASRIKVKPGNFILKKHNINSEKIHVKTGSLKDFAKKLNFNENLIMTGDIKQNVDIVDIIEKQVNNRNQDTTKNSILKLKTNADQKNNSYINIDLPKENLRNKNIYNVNENSTFMNDNNSKIDSKIDSKNNNQLHDNKKIFNHGTDPVIRFDKNNNCFMTDNVIESKNEIITHGLLSNNEYEYEYESQNIPYYMENRIENKVYKKNINEYDVVDNLPINKSSQVENIVNQDIENRSDILFSDKEFMINSKFENKTEIKKISDVNKLYKKLYDELNKEFRRFYGEN